MKKNLLYVLMAAFIFAACEKEDTNITKDSSDFSIDGYILDGDGNVPMKDVVVKGAFGETKTNEIGYFKVSGLNHGTYSVIFEKSGYGKMIQTFDLSANTNTPLEVDYTASTKVFMFKMNKSMETTIWKVLNNKREELANVPYTINLLSPVSGVTFLYNKIEGTTDANGQISVSDTLPNANVNININYVDEAAGKVYQLDQDVNPSTVSKSLTVTANSLTDNLYLKTSSIFDAKGQTQTEFPKEMSITFDFNQILDIKTTATLRNTTDGVAVAAVVSVSGKTLTIDPIGNLYESKTFRVEFEAVSGDKTLSGDYTFSTPGAFKTLGPVTGLSVKSPTTITSTTSSVIIKCTKVPNATSYEIYGKYGNLQTEYQKLGYSWWAKTYTGSIIPDEEIELYMSSSLLANMTIPADGFFADGKTLTIIVRAKAGDIYGEFSAPLEIKK